MSKLKKELSQTKYKLANDMSEVLYGLIKDTPRKKLAAEILSLSRNFQDSTSCTPWKSPLSQLAYLAYFFPLNYLRNQAVFSRLTEFIDINEFSRVLDVGSGCGTSHLALNNASEYEFIEISPEAIGLHKKLLKSLGRSTQHKWSSTFNGLKENQLVVFSYSLNELSGIPDWIYDCEDLLIIEPSTHQAGRELLKFRAQAIEKGFYSWAPCVHQGACPLLTHSKKDWCHDRIFIDMPDWWKNIQALLPMKNSSITFSYLYLSKRPSPEMTSNARLIGDTLKQKGKTVQMACRGENREFLSWMKKLKIKDTYHRGELVKIPDNASVAGNEIRITEDL